MFKPDRSVAAAHVAAWATLAAAAFGTAPAAAQTAAPSPPPAAAKADAKADAKAEAAAEAAAAAMERARRQAAGPLRVILEASKSRRRATDADPPAAAEASVVRPVVARTPAAAAAPQAAPVSAESRPVAAAPPAAAATTPSGSATPVVPEPGIVTGITLNSAALRAQPTIAAVPALDLKGSTPLTGAAVPETPALALPELAAAPVRPRLASVVEPELPQRVLEELGRNAAVLVDLTIRPNGSVSKVALVSAGPRQLMRFLEPTLMEWKFDPLPSERVHRIELVFNGDS
ncbi:MAG: hypothetical protein Q8R98_22945 [Rubrivivax sp.]|nr:hypothetical protein [Rubrivivax sp.]MDP3614709.1 hypothetical protein [Rubrivivax sp.]